MALFSAPTGAYTPNQPSVLQAGAPDYQEAILQGTERSLVPRYRQAQQGLEQNLSNRGLLDSGIAAGGELGLKEAYLQQLGQAANRAAVGGADLAEQRRQRAENRQWAVEDKNTLEARLRRQAEMEESRANQQIWNSLISTGAGAVGTYFGGPMGGAAASQGTQALLNKNQEDKYADQALFENDQALSNLGQVGY